jgi:hypothetical protein
VGRKSSAKALRRMNRAESSIRGSTEAKALPWPTTAVDGPVTSFGTRIPPWTLVDPEGKTPNRIADRTGSGSVAPIAALPALRSPPPGSVDPVERLRSLAVERQLLERAVEREVVALLNSGYSWTTIGRGLGLTRQGARQHYCRLLDGTDEESRVPNSYASHPASSSSTALYPEYPSVGEVRLRSRSPTFGASVGLTSATRNELDSREIGKVSG